MAIVAYRRPNSAARGAKVKTLSTMFREYPRFKAVDIPDISSTDLSSDLRGLSYYVSYE